MKISLYIYNPYPSIGGGDKTLHRFVNSINLKKFNVTILSLRSSTSILKKINFIKLNSKSTFWSFFEIKKIILNDKSDKKIFFSMQYFVNAPALIFLKKNSQP